jgi:hypothetical protein
MQPIFYQRDNTTRATLAPVQFSVRQMRWVDQGGCDTAQIEASGAQLDLMALSDYLRYPVEIYDGIGRRCWWGFVNRVIVPCGVYQYEISLDRMYNSIAVAYSYIAPSTTEVGARKTTAYTTDTISIAEFGQKDLLQSAGGMADAAATALRDTLLTMRKIPQGGISLGGDGGSATLECLGWYHNIKWRQASLAAGADVNTVTKMGSILTSFGGYVSGIDCDFTSAISTTAYLDGDTDAWTELLRLMDIGGPNTRRALAEIIPQRRLHVWEEDAATVVNYQSLSNGAMTNLGGEIIPDHLWPVGVWVKLRDVLSGTVSTVGMTDPTLQFVTAVDWQDGVSRPTFRGSYDELELFGVV